MTPLSILDGWQFFLNTKEQRNTKLDVDSPRPQRGDMMLTPLGGRGLSTSNFVLLCVFVFKKLHSILTQILLFIFHFSLSSSLQIHND